MRGNVGFSVRPATALVFLYVAGLCFASVSVVNYDNHPDLEKAKQYDLTIDNKRFRLADGNFDWASYRSYQAKANRTLAEKHYLTYLEDANDSFQRAAVYARLGEIFSGIADPRVATTIDRDKARMYYRKALEAEPERIGMATLQARGFFATDAEADEQRFASYMDYYEWLLSIDAKTLKEKWLPTRPPQQAAPASPQVERYRRLREQFERDMAQAPAPPRTAGGGFLGLIKGQADTTAYNLVHEAMGRMAYDVRTRQWSQGRAVHHLLVLAERFPGTSVAERARAELARIVSGLSGYVLPVP